MNRKLKSMKNINTLDKRIISHRGNLFGPEPELENNPDFIMSALEAGYECEIDVWFVKDNLYLGHDEPQYEVNLKFLQNVKLWCHAKNLSALDYMIQHNVHCFWHQSDDYTVTSQGIIWSYPGKKLVDSAICVMPENIYEFNDLPECLGYCTDYPSKIIL